jgi:hypothetical protein
MKEREVPKSGNGKLQEVREMPSRKRNKEGQM